jgi:hypothetical protein
MSKKKRDNKNKIQNKYAAEKRVAKKAAVLGTQKKSRTPIVLFISIFVLLIGGGIFFMSQKGAGKGYYQAGDFMVCRNCKREFASVLVNVVKGGCNPAPLNRTIRDGKVIIAVPDILEGRPYFNFSERV